MMVSQRDAFAGDEEDGTVAYSNPLLECWRAGRPALGLWCMTANPAAAEYAAQIDVDWILWDQQHGLVTDADLAQLFRACLGRPVAPLARVAANDLTLIGRALDAGAAGVVVPLVNTAEEAARAAAACRYPPHGNRSFGPNRIGLVVGSYDPDEIATVACIVMVETATGLANVEAIAATPGVDAILVGPSDLALGLGMAPTDRGPTHAAAVRRIADVCRANSIAAGIVLGDGTTGRAHLELGFTFVSIATDIGVLTSGVTRELAIARGGREGV
jgi:4-hydroxy-2-oxoheptanedioate aldolase